MEKQKFLIQEQQYFFPYHWIQYESDSTMKVLIQYRAHFMYTTYVNKVVEEVMKVDAEISVLDVGCGDGKLLSILKEKGGNRVKLCGCDMAEQAILFAKAFNNDIEWRCQDFNKLDEKYSVVTCIEVLEHIPDEELKVFISGLCKKLNESGKLIITVPTIFAPVAKKHYRHYSLQLLEEQLKRYAPEYAITKSIFLNKYSIIMKNYINLFYQCNRFIRINCLEKIFWKYYEKHCTVGKNEQDSLRLMAIIEKRNK